ncbi:MAG: hybrid sensor histidine kinase/response regulator [Micavibrio sp.]|nr:hybrid sensor histidine kinase/response regulator [Micavibrio sp.]
MKLDHSEFIARHHKMPQMPPPEGEEQKPSFRSFIWLIVIAAFCGFIAFVYLDPNMLTAMKIAVIFMAVLVAMTGFIIYRSFILHRNQNEELELIREVMEGSRGGRLITDKQNKTLYTNQKFDRLCRGVGVPGYASLLRLFEDNPEGTAHFRLLAEQAHRGLTDSIELFSKFEDRERWLLITAQPVAGRAGYVHWRIDDVTDKHTAEIAIRDEREKLIDFTDNAPVGFFSVDEKGRFVFANATLARWLGEDIRVILDGGELHTYLLDPPEDARPFDVVSGNRTRQIAEVKMKATAGKTFLASINQTIVEEPGGRVRTRAVVHDLTTEREMRKALQASEDRFQRFFDEAPLGIILLDSEGTVEDCNAAFAAMLAMNIDAIEGQDFERFINEGDRQKILGAIDKIERGGQLDAPLEITLIKGDEKSVDAQMFARRFKAGGNIVLHFIDLSEKRALEAQFAQGQKMQAIGQLAGGVAHDFNNLLTAIIGFCDLLLLRHKPGDPSFGDIMQIKQNSNRAANLVRQLLAFSRQQTLRPKIHDVSDILTELSHLMRRLLGANIELDLVHGQDLGLIKVDEGQMEQVLINLAVNARDAMNEKGSGGSLTIETENFTNRSAKKLVAETMPAGHWVLIKVTDTGCGIPKENLDRIFEPFFTTKAVGEGTGLGLATVYGIVRQTGGYLDVESKVDQGTSFLIYLPRSNEADDEEETVQELGPVEAKDLTGSERILLVEDEDAVRTFSQRALSNKGYEVLTADCGESGVSVFDENGDQPLDLLITDVVMPGMDGPTLAEYIRKKKPELKIIFMSGYTEDKLKDHMGKNIYFLPKPFTLKQLAEKVKHVLDDK